MQEFVYFALLTFSVIVWPIWLFRRMRRLRAMSSGPDRDVAERRAAMSHHPFVDEVKGADGLTYARPMDVDPDMVSAERKAAELPDINQTLQGKR